MLCDTRAVLHTFACHYVTNRVEDEARVRNTKRLPLLQSRSPSAYINYILKNVVFSDVTTCESIKNRRFGGTYRLHHQGGNI
jgi:hypothetical protein